jgi:hypothetical protein
MHFHPPAGDDRPALAPVGLALLPRRRLEPDRRLDLRFPPQRADEALDDIVAPLIAADLELFVDRLGAVTHRRQPLQDILPVRAQKTALLSRPRIDLRLLLAKDFADRLDVELQSAGDRLLRLLELPAAVDLVPQIPFDHVLSSRTDCREEVYVIDAHACTPFRGGIFNAHKGGLLHAR